LRKRSWASALALALAAVAGGCGGGGEDTGDATLSVYVSLSESEADGRDATDGAILALADAGGEAAGIAVEAEVLEDAPGWGPVEAAANARVATQDSSAIAYLGDFESGATRASLPVTNGARLLQVSPASAAMDLVEARPGADEVPVAQPSGARTFGRVIPGDEAQAAAGAEWIVAIDRPARTESDGSAYGDTMVAGFEAGFNEFPFPEAGTRGILYFGGLPSAKLPEGGRPLMVTDAQLVPLDDALPAGTLATAAALAPAQLPAEGQEFVERFEAEYGRAPGPYAAYGYEAMAVILDSIERAAQPTDRQAVIDAFLATSERESVLGTYSIDELGETTLNRMTGYEFKAGEPRPAAVIGG
jgi:branched-chain amino acid transport system substrate-binding protein